MTRRLFNFACAASLVVFIAAAALWVRSYFVQDTIYLHRRKLTPARFYVSDHRGYSVNGQLVWTISVYAEPPNQAEAERRSREKEGLKDFYYRPAKPTESYFNPANRSDPLPARLGFRYKTANFNRVEPVLMSQQFFEAGVPHWLFVALAAPLPVWFACRQLLRWIRRRRPGVCASCGYDLRASAERCPECGAATAAATGVSG